MKIFFNFFTKDIPYYIHKDYLITFSFFLLVIFTYNRLWIENTTISILILIIILILLVLSAVGPKTLLNFIFEQTSNGTKISFNRHIPTEEEKKFITEVEYLNIHDLENEEMYEKSINRCFKEKSDFDFLIISTKLWKEKKFDEALEQAYYGLYISNDSKIKSLLNMRIGTIFSNLNKYEVAKDKYKKAISINPQNSKAYNNLSIKYINENNFQKAKKLLLESLKLDNKNFNTYNTLGMLYNIKEFEEFSYKKAEEYLLKSIKLKPKENQPYKNIALLYLDKEFPNFNLNKAKEYLLKALSIDEKDPILLNDLGLTYIKLNDFDKAKKYLEASYEIKKDSPSTLDSLGELYMELGDFQLSEKYFKKAIELDNQNIIYYENLIKLYDKYNKKEEKLQIKNEFEKIKKEKNQGC